jgi:hypothetical protein
MPALETITALAVPDSILVMAHVIVDVSPIAGPVTSRGAGKEAISAQAGCHRERQEDRSREDPSDPKPHAREGRHL